MSKGPEQGAWSRAAEELVVALRRGEALRESVLGELLAAVAERPPAATWHPTGFIVLELLRDDEGALRLHLWPEGERKRGRPCWPVHDHIWDLRSRVLCGSVSSHDYEVHDDVEGSSMLYAVEYAAGSSSCMRRSERRVSARARVPRRMEAGQRYSVTAGVFHASRVEPGGFAATLVATEIGSRARPWVLGPVDGPKVVPVERPRADPQSVQAMVERVGGRL